MKPKKKKKKKHVFSILSLQLQQTEVMNKSFQTVFKRESEFIINYITATEYLMENIKVDKRSKTTNERAGSGWSVELDYEKMQ